MLPKYSNAFHFVNQKEKKNNRNQKTENNKLDRATMRPNCVSGCIEHVTYMERQMNEFTDETTK